MKEVCMYVKNLYYNGRLSKSGPGKVRRSFLFESKVPLTSVAKLNRIILSLFRMTTTLLPQRRSDTGLRRQRR